MDYLSTDDVRLTASATSSSAGERHMNARLLQPVEQRLVRCDLDLLARSLGDDFEGRITRDHRRAEALEVDCFRGPAKPFRDFDRFSHQGFGTAHIQVGALRLTPE